MIKEGDTKPVFIVWTNSDLTEGRGHQVPLHACYLRATALRLAQNQGVQGSNADVRESAAIYHRGNWCAPTRFTEPSDADQRAQVQYNQRSAALAKAKAAGLSADDLRALGFDERTDQ